MTTVPSLRARETHPSAPRPFDFWMLAASVLLVLGGLAALASVDPSGGLMKSQLRFAAVGIPVLFAAAFINVHFWRGRVLSLYTLNIALLILILIFGDTKYGATRWLYIGPLQFQPSELTKILVAITLSAYFHENRARAREPEIFVGSLLHILPFLVLLLLQPHLGATLTVVVIWLTISILAGVRWRAIGGAVIAACLLLGGLVAAVYTINVPLFSHVKTRIDGKLNPDPNDNAYQSDQAKLAIAVGGLTGVGYGDGEQKKGNFVPFKQNDFIFTVIGEEGGFVGSALLLASYLFFFARCWIVTAEASTTYGRCLSGGLTAAIAFHVVVNLGMNLAITPVVGLWLPFISSGGTALLMCLASVGLMIGIRRTA